MLMIAETAGVGVGDVGRVMASQRLLRAAPSYTLHPRSGDVMLCAGPCYAAA